jgi:hypothetical protein
VSVWYAESTTSHFSVVIFTKEARLDSEGGNQGKKETTKYNILDMQPVQ